jgi:hypothetical protein
MVDSTSVTAQDEQQYRRYVHVDLPRARTIADRIGRSLEAFGQAEDGAAALRADSPLR